jgi:diguanylate cyclase (GGDEF)-like protein
MSRFEEAQQALRSLAESVTSSLVSANGEVSKAESTRSAIESGRVVNPGTGEEIRRVTVSIGITLFVLGEEAKETTSRADEALYAAKENGRNRVEVNPPPDSIKAVSQ